MILVVYIAVIGVPVKGDSDRPDVDGVVAGVNNYCKRSGVTVVEQKVVDSPDMHPAAILPSLTVLERMRPRC
jgi:hypothetical protein